MGASRWLRWRSASLEDHKTGGLRDRQYRISHLLWGVFLLSLCLGLSRLALPQYDLREAYVDRELLVILPTMAFANLLAAVPCIWGAFAPWRWIFPLAVGWLLYAAMISVLEVSVLIAFLGSPGRQDVPMSVLFGMINITQGVTVWLTLVVLRLAGYRLVRTDSRK